MAPRRIDSTALSMAEKAVMMMTGRTGSRRRDLSSTASPSTLGIRRSVTTASTPPASSRAIASAPELTAIAW